MDSSYLPSELNAAYLYAQLEARDQIFAKRMEIYNYYHKNLAHLAQEGKIEQPYVPGGMQPQCPYVLYQGA